MGAAIANSIVPVQVVFFIYSPSHGDKHNIQKDDVKRLFVEKELITSVLTELQEEEPTTRDKWLTLAAWKTLLC
jgi:hypothetical protein